MLAPYGGATGQSGESSTAPIDDPWLEDFDDVDEEYADDEAFEAGAVVEYVYGPPDMMA